MRMEAEKQRILDLACKLKRKRSSSAGNPGKRFKLAPDESGSSTITDWENPPSKVISNGGGEQEVLVELESSSKEYSDVAEMFFKGLGVLHQDISIRGICRVSRGSEGYRMQQEFERQLLKMVDRRGDANVQWAWYGPDHQEADAIIKHGFEMAIPSGVGYCFAPNECSRISAVQARVDNVGEQRSILCQMIVGKIGLVNPGYDQSVDTSVYDLSTPKCLIIPSTSFEPSRVLAHHVIRFKLSEQWQEIIKALAISRKSLPQAVKLNQRKVSANQQLASCKIMSFPTLFRILQTRIPQADLLQLQQSYYHFKSGRISKSDLIHEVRETVSDKLLYKCMSIIKLWSQRPEN